MKKLIGCVLILMCLLGLVGCWKSEMYKVSFTVPAGSTSKYVYSDEEIIATGNKIIIWCGEGLGDTEVILQPINEKTETGYVATYLTPGVPVEFEAVKGELYRLGVLMQNDTDTDKIVYVEVEGVEVRIE